MRRSRGTDAACGASARYDLVTPAGETTTERHDDVTASLPEPGDRRRTLLAFAPYLVALGRARGGAGRGPRRGGARVEAAPHAGPRARRAPDGSPAARSRAGAAARRDRLLVGRRRAAEHPGRLGFVVGLGVVPARARRVRRAVPPPPGARTPPARVDRRVRGVVRRVPRPARAASRRPARAGGPVRPRPRRHGGARGRPGRAASPSAARCSSSRTRCSRSGGSCRATSSPPHDLVVMSTYLAAQGLIALGVVRVHRRRVSSGALASTASASTQA